MKILSLLMLLLLAVAPVQQSNVKPELGTKLGKSEVKKSDDLTLTHPAQLRPSIERTIGGVVYLLAYDPKNREVRYIFTDDKEFRAAGGAKVGDIIELTREEIIAYPGWEIHAAETSDGWHPLIGFDDKIARPDDAVDFKGLKEGEKLRAKILGFVKGGN
ncbi:MAG TPA: hypothetical protein VJT74_08920 [Pyrinomonadaceae bacterium]|nr:hypothetical protein [Pyrinomonadaceae bacterium]